MTNHKKTDVKNEAAVKKPLKKGRKAMKIVLITLGLFLILIGTALGVYAYRNMNFDKHMMDGVWKAGFVEKQTTLPNGVLLNYAEGPDHGPALLLINGQAMQWEDYSKCLPELSKYYHVYAVDCHGHGESSHDASRYTCAKMGEDFGTFIETVIGKSCVISGLSSGGILSTWVAANRPELVSGLIIEDSPFFSVLPEEMQNTFVWKDGFLLGHNYLVEKPDVSYPVYYFQHSYLWSLFGGLQKLVGDLAKKYQAAHPNEAIKLWFLPYNMTYGTMYMMNYDLNFCETFYNGSWFDGTDQADILSRVECPTIYMKVKTRYGKDGVQWAANSDEDALKVQSLLKYGKMIHITDTGHDVHFDNATEFSQIFIDFLSEIK
jgi:pimeloyl-ACP methyl ester carboxylesterase